MFKLFLAGICFLILKPTAIHAQSDMGRQLKQLLEYSKEGFNSLKKLPGEKREKRDDIPNWELYTRYETDFKVEEAFSCYILEDKDKSYFIAWFTYKEEEFSTYEAKIWIALGVNDFYPENNGIKTEYNSSPFNKTVYYSKKTKEPVMELIKYNGYKNPMCNTGLSLIIEGRKNRTGFLTNEKKPAVNFCSRLKSILSHAYTGFEKINSGKDQDDENSKLMEVKDDFIPLSISFKSLLDFPGAELSTVNEGFLGGPGSYSAYFGAYENKTIARKKTDSLKTLLTGCLQGYIVSTKQDLKSSPAVLVNYGFKEKRKDKIPPQKLSLNLTEENIYTGKREKIFYKIHLDIDGLEQSDTKNEDREKIVSLLSDVLTPEILGDNLKELLKHSETKFRSITKEEIKEESKSFSFHKSETVFKTDLWLPGAIECRITEYFDAVIKDMNRTEYKAVFINNAADAEALKKFNELSDRLKENLGDDFTYKTETPQWDEGSRNMTITPKNNNKHTIGLKLINRGTNSERKMEVSIIVK